MVMNMLKDKRMFDIVEETLKNNGKLSEFEKEYGKIKGRMMITIGEIPDELGVTIEGDKKPTAFEASFDFYDSIIGFALYADTKEAATGLWVTPQKKGAAEPDRAWIEFFVEKLMESIRADGSFGTPVYSFVTYDRDMTIVPEL